MSDSGSTTPSIDERTPLLPPHVPPPVPPKAASPPNLTPYAPTPDPLDRPHIHFEPSRPPNDSVRLIACFARFAAALDAGHLPSSTQLIALFDLVLASPLLEEDPQGTVWSPQYGEGRLGVGELSREGERVRLAARESVWSLRELVEGRNPVLKTVDGELVGETDTGETGDGWQEFLWRCKGSEVDVDLPSASLPKPDSGDVSSARASLLDLIRLLLTSPDLRGLLSDLVLLVRDTIDVVLEAAAARDQISSQTAEALERVVEAATEGAVGPSKVREHDGDPDALSHPPRAHENAGQKTEVDVKLEGDEQKVNGALPDPPTVEIRLNGEAYTPADEEEDPLHEASSRERPARQKSPEQIKDEFIDRFRTVGCFRPSTCVVSLTTLVQILLKLQKTSTCQQSMRTLLSLVRSYLRKALDSATPHVSVDEAVDLKTAKAAPVHADDPTALLIPLLEPFTGGAGSLAHLRASFHSLLAHLDPSQPGTSSARLRALATSLDAYLSRALLSPGWLGSSESYRALGELHDMLTTLGDDSPALKHDFGTVLQGLIDALGAVANDPLLARAVQAVEELALALVGWVEAIGSVARRAAAGEGVAAVWGDVIEWLVPRVLGVLKEVPMPRVEFASPSISLAIDPPSLLSTSFIPSSLSLRQSTSLTYIPALGSAAAALPPSASQPTSAALAHSSAKARTNYATSTLLSVEGLQLSIRDVGYFAQYHTGIPCVGDVTESGLLDLQFGTPGSSAAADGLSFSLSTTTPVPCAAAEQSLFHLDKSQTRVRLSHFSITPHQSSHPWLLFLLRPVLRTAVRKVVEKEVREKVLEAGAEWVGRVGWRATERERELREEQDEAARGEDGEKRGKEDAQSSAWRWARAIWDALVYSPDEDEDDKATVPELEPEEDDKPDAHPSWHLHLNRHGVAVDLEAANGTVGLGTEGVVIPEGDAPIPLPEGQTPPKGLVRAAKDEVRHEVQAGQEFTRETMQVAGEMGEAAEGHEEEVERQKRTRPHSWRSEAFDL
ncbi:hypothetical protein Rhopal_007138-T1 [Rhodotorula paludigena]|uniref:HAM1-like N-terminal domain-containing protein n=1 Tax=Rhodotorula paludigena TaxID=86838 RepID=A0AAV5GU70_9BASI|nr:hypothetical protein Rhopal_007138-T1 [Rhodotorula paludigena]